MNLCRRMKIKDGPSGGRPANRLMRKEVSRGNANLLDRAARCAPIVPRSVGQGATRAAEARGPPAAGHALAAFFRLESPQTGTSIVRETAPKASRNLNPQMGRSVRDVGWRLHNQAIARPVVALCDHPCAARNPPLVQVWPCWKPPADYGLISKIASISTAAPVGSAAKPKALRAW